MKTAIVHEFFHTLGGAENVLREMHILYPEAPIFFLTRNTALAKQQYPKNNLHASYLRRLPQYFHKHPQTVLPLLPIAAESLNLRDFDVILTSSNSFAKGIVTRAHTTHICYCHSPTRYLWDYYHETIQEHRISRVFLKVLFHHLRMWDIQAASRVDAFIANSHYTAKRIQKYYHRDAEVIYPPVDIERFTPTSNPDGPYIMVSRLSQYKKIDAAIHACNTLKLPLTIIGEGKERKHLQKIAGPTIQFTGFVDITTLKHYYQQARALIFPCLDDFGIVAVEALAAGTPVLALKKGGVIESQVEGMTGEFFSESTTHDIVQTIKQFEQKKEKYSPKILHSHAEKFSKEQFRTNFQEAIQQRISQKHTPSKDSDMSSFQK